MTEDRLEALAARLRRGESLDEVELIKSSPVRKVVRCGDVLLKVFLKSTQRPRREARALDRAKRLGLPVPELLGNQNDWVATRWIESRPAERDDLDRILPAVARMHASGMLHGDLHLGNILIAGNQPILIDLQRTRFMPWIPGWVRERELGYLAFSLGDPLPKSLRHVRFWRDIRAQRHWRSRTKRCLIESSAFTRWAYQQDEGFRRREIDAPALTATLDAATAGEVLKDGPKTWLYRVGPWIVKRHESRHAARAAWSGALGLEERGMGVARALAWVGPWIVMEDAGMTLIEWVESQYDAAPDTETVALANSLGELLAALHRRGIYHADLKANNIALTPHGPAQLLDYGDVHFGWRVSYRRRVKNLAQVNAALPNLVPGKVRIQTLERYLEASESTLEAAALKRDVVRESLKRQHRWTGC